MYAVTVTVTDPLYTGGAAGTLRIYAPVQPTAQTVVAGTAITLYATNPTQLLATYQWLRNGVPISGATGPSLTLSNIALAQAGAYSVVLTTVDGSTTTLVSTLTVIAGSFTGSYFGTLGTNQGTFALIVRPDGSVSLLLFVTSTHTATASPRGLAPTAVSAARSSRSPIPLHPSRSVARSASKPRPSKPPTTP